MGNAPVIYYFSQRYLAPASLRGKPMKAVARGKKKARNDAGLSGGV